MIMNAAPGSIDYVSFFVSIHYRDYVMQLLFIMVLVRWYLREELIH